MPSQNLTAPTSRDHRNRCSQGGQPLPLAECPTFPHLKPLFKTAPSPFPTTPPKFQRYLPISCILVIMPTYWSCQLLGWLAYSAIGITINLLNGSQLRPLIVGHILLISLSIGLTHLSRNEIRKRRSADSPVTRQWPFLATAIFLISLIQTALVIGTNLVLVGGTWPVTAVVALWWGMFIATGVWTILYIRFTERRTHAVREDRLQLALREAELRALESQINPHFLFNCLNSIRALVVIDPPRAQEMVTRLANVLRNSLRHDRQHTVPLVSELESVADYLALEAIRFEERLRSEIAVDPAVAQCFIPPMLLQTLVENAIKHGIGRVTGVGSLNIRAELIEGAIRLVVENTGRLASTPPTPNQLGLVNIRERLSLLYGERASLKLDDDNGLVRATVLIPALL
jgi:two-component system LytT family sensor kinase